MEEFKYVGAAFAQKGLWLPPEMPDGHEFTLDAFFGDPKQTFRILRSNAAGEGYAGYAVCIKTYADEDVPDEEADYEWSKYEIPLELSVPAEPFFAVGRTNGTRDKFIPGAYDARVDKQGNLWIEDSSTKYPPFVYAAGQWTHAGTFVGGGE